jgi:hypothetical protein
MLAGVKEKIHVSRHSLSAFKSLPPPAVREIQHPYACQRLVRSPSLVALSGREGPTAVLRTGHSVDVLNVLRQQVLVPGCTTVLRAEYLSATRGTVDLVGITVMQPH